MSLNLGMQINEKEKRLHRKVLITKQRKMFSQIFAVSSTEKSELKMSSGLLLLR